MFIATIWQVKQDYKGTQGMEEERQRERRCEEFNHFEKIERYLN